MVRNKAVKADHRTGGLIWLPQTIESQTEFFAKASIRSEEGLRKERRGCYGV